MQLKKFLNKKGHIYFLYNWRPILEELQCNELVSSYVIKFLYEVWATLSSSAVTINAPKRNSTAYVKYISPPEKPVMAPKNTALRIDFLWNGTTCISLSIHCQYTACQSLHTYVDHEFSLQINFPFFPLNPVMPQF